MEDDDCNHGNEINETATENMARSKEKAVREAHSAGWKLDNDGWYIKPINPSKVGKAREFIRERGFRGFISKEHNYDVAVIGEAADALSLDLHLMFSE